MGELHRDDAIGLEQKLHAGNEIIDIRHVRQNVITEQQIRSAKLLANLSGSSPSEEAANRPNTTGDGGLGHVVRRLDAENRNAASNEMLQQVPVVAGNFHHAATGA